MNARHSLASKRSSGPAGSFVSFTRTCPLASRATATHSPLPAHMVLTRHLIAAGAGAFSAPPFVPFIVSFPPSRSAPHLAYVDRQDPLEGLRRMMSDPRQRDIESVRGSRSLRQVESVLRTAFARGLKRAELARTLPYFDW